MKNNFYSVIVFDLGNVLIPFDYNIAIRRFNEIESGLGEKYYDYFMNNYNIHREFERGNISETEFINHFLNLFDNKISRETFCKIYSEIFTVNEDVTLLLPKLKANYKLVLLSNTNSIHQKYGWQQYEFLKYFDKLILSHQVGSVKPEEKIYKAVEEFTKQPSEEHLFIDDVPEYIEGAKKLGWSGIVFKGYDNLIKEMESLGIKI